MKKRFCLLINPYPSLPQILATDRRHSTADVVLNQPECRRFFVNMLNDPDMRLQTRAMSCFCLSILAKNSQKNQVILDAVSKFCYCGDDISFILDLLVMIYKYLSK